MLGLHQGAHVVVLFEQFDAEKQEVVEVHRVQSTQLGVVGLKNGGIERLLGVAESFGFVFGAADSRLRFVHIVGLVFGDEAHDHALEQADLLTLGINDEVFLVAHALGVLTQESAAEGVKGAEHDFFSPTSGDHARDALAHFIGGLVGEGHGQDVLRRNAFIHHVGDARGDSARFTRACTGEDEQGTLDGFDSFPLLGIEQPH